MAIPAEFHKLWANLPQWSDAKDVPGPNGSPATQKAFPQIPGLTIPIAWETCCIQMSHALNKSGLKVSYSNKQRVLRDTAGNEYMLDVAEMRGYLDQQYGKAESLSRVDVHGSVVPRIALQGALDERKGILAFGGRHIDLWNGSRIHGENYIEAALWEASSAISIGLFFWEVTSAASP